MKNLDKYRGCLIGGAAGDALGYAVEFKGENQIFSQYGENGITEYVLEDGIAVFSDDTQMTLFTANGLLLAQTAEVTQGGQKPYAYYINRCYEDWYRTQYEDYPLKDKYFESWLVNIPRLFAWRAPGNSCLSAIENPDFGSIEEPINNSKGCGGVMRVAPIGLFFDNTEMPIDQIDRIGAEAAALTHGHSLGYITSAGLVHIVNLLAHTDIALPDAVKDMEQAMAKQFAGDKHLDSFLQLTEKAIELSASDSSDLDAIHQLGEGWVAEETLAIAIYCALKYSNNFDKAIITAVNHKGDSDSTGAVTGNILGAYLGLKGIPQKYLDNLELKEVILEIADDLFHDCPNEKDIAWKQKYINGTYSLQG